jgi:hypothetical protein
MKRKEKKRRSNNNNGVRWVAMAAWLTLAEAGSGFLVISTPIYLFGFGGGRRENHITELFF